MADNQVLIKLLARADFQQAISQTNKLGLTIGQLQKAAALAPYNRLPYVFDAGKIRNTGAAWRRYREELSRSIPILSRVLVEHQKAMQSGALVVSGTRALTAGGRGARALLAPPGGSGGGVGGALALRGVGGSGGGPPIYNGVDVPGSGGGGGNAGSRFNFGQLFTGIVMLDASRRISGFVSESVQKFSEFELAVRRIEVVSGASFKSLSDGILELSRVIPFSMDDISEAFLVAGQAGLKSAEEIKAVTFAASLLAFKFGDDLGDTTKRLIQIQTQFNLTMGQTGAILGILSVTSGDTLSDIESLSTALTRAGATAKIANLSLSETAAAIGAAAQSGIESQRAGTELRRLITELEKLTSGRSSSAKQSLATKLFGTNFREDLDIANRGLASVVDTISAGTASVSEMSALVGEIPGRILSGLVAFSNKLRESGDSFAAFEERIREGKITAKDYELLLGNLASKQQIFNNRIEELKISFGEAFGPVAEFAMLALQGILDIIKGLSPEAKIAVVAVLGLTTAFIGLSLILPVVLGLLAPFMPFFLAFVVAARLVQNPLQAIKDGLKGVQMVLENMLPGMKMFATVFWPMIKDRVEPVKKLMDDFANDTLKNVANGIEEFKLDHLIPSFKAMAEELQKANDAAKSEIIEKYAKSLNTAAIAAKQATVEVEKFRYVMEDLTIHSQEDFQTMVDGIIPTWTDAIFDLITKAKTFGDVWKDIQNAALKDFIEGFLQGMFQAHAQTLGQMTANWLTFSQTTGQGSGGGVGGIITSIAGLFGGFGGGGATSAVSSSSSVYTGVRGVSAMNPFTAFADGGIVTKPTLGLFGEAGPEAVIPLDRIGNSSRDQNITVVNIVDQNFVNQALIDDPDVIVNTINADLIRNGTTRKTIRRYTK